MAIYGTFPYIPLLEGHAGKVYLTNNDNLPLEYRSGHLGNIPQAVASIANGVLAFGPGSDAAYQGRMTIGYNGGTTRTELQYNGANWAPTMSDNFLIIPVLRDISYVSPSNQYDIHQFTPWHTNPGDVDVYGQRSGGSDYRVFVWALGVPEVASISPTLIPADGQSHIITITLKRRLHSSQVPNVLVSLDAGTVTLGNPLPIKNADGQITGWTVSAIANTQPATTANLHLTITETLTYLKTDLITTELVTYLDADVGQVTIQNMAAGAPLTIKSASLAAGSGVDPILGYLSGGMFMGGQTVRVQVTNGENWFGTVDIVGKPTGMNHRTVLASASTDGAVFTTLDGGGNTLYQQNYICNFDTVTDLRAYPKWDLGYVVQTPVGEINNWFGSYVNGNLTDNIPAYTIYVRFGTETYQGSYKSGAFSWDTPSTNPLKGLLQFFIVDNWNVSDQGLPLAPTYIDTQIDAGSIVTTALPSTGTAFTNLITGRSEMAREFLTVDTTAWVDGAHTIDWTLYRSYASSNTRQPQSSTISITTNQSGAGGTVPSYVVTTYGALPPAYDRHYNTAIDWNIQAASLNQFTGSIAWSVTGLPSGSTGIFTPGSGNLLSDGLLTTTLTVTAPTAVVGTFPLTVHAVSGALDITCNITLEVINSGTPGGGGGCVPAGTMLFTPNGMVRIEDAVVGMEVLGFDEKTLQPVVSHVAETLSYTDREIYRIVTAVDTFECSHDHRLALLAPGGGMISYLPARDLVARDRIMHLTGDKPEPALVFAVEPTGRYETVYHIKMTEGHVFVAGGYLAHNMKTEYQPEL